MATTQREFLNYKKQFLSFPLPFFQKDISITNFNTKNPEAEARDRGRAIQAKPDMPQSGFWLFPWVILRQIWELGYDGHQWHCNSDPTSGQKYDALSTHHLLSHP